MNRRNFLAAVASLPLLAWPEPAAAKPVLPRPPETSVSYYVIDAFGGRARLDDEFWTRKARVPGD